MVAGERDQELDFQAGVCKVLEMHGFHESGEITRQVGRRGRKGLWLRNLDPLQTLNSHLGTGELRWSWGIRMVQRWREMVHPTTGPKQQALG